eukprot:scaffold58694_cov72-Cyclotella_meneghiniana.AAC.7
MKGFNLIISVLSIHFAQVQSQTDVNYTDEQCTEWLSIAKSADLDGSGGLSQDEYYSFLTSIGEPTYISDYFSQYVDFASLPWEQKVIYRTMACNCMRMGQGSACCMGDDIEIMLDPIEEGGFAQVRQSVMQDEYDALLCQQIAFLVSSVDAPPALPPGSASPVEDVDGEETDNSGSDEQGSGLTAEAEGSSATAEEEDSNNTTEDEDSSATVEAEASNEIGADASYQEETTNSGLGAAAIVGILFAIFAPICACCFFAAHQRKLEEEKRLREFAGEAAKDDHLAAFDAKNDNKEEEIVVAPMPDQEEEIVVKPEGDDESKDDDSVWSDSEDKKDIIVESEQEAPKGLVGSALAAMGVASSVATSVASPTNSKKEDDITKIEAFV